MFWDEMRLGCIGQVRRRWAPRGLKVVQKVRVAYEWRYLVLAVAPCTGQLWWTWLEDMGAESLQRALEQAKKEIRLEVVIWDRAPGHRARCLGATVERIFQPPYSPELQPVERLFEELRREVEGQVYDALEAKMQAAEAMLRTWQQDPEKVRSLTAWSWIREAFNCPTL